MPLAFHDDPEAKYEHQHLNAERNIVPFIEKVIPIEGKQVLEVGCGEGGILKAFLDRGCRCVGLDLSASRIGSARRLFEPYVSSGQAEFEAFDVHDPEVQRRYAGRFDLIILKDAIEHIYGHEKLLRALPDLLAPGGMVFIAFPPWLMPYGGHQQLADTRLGKLPFYHILPRPLYRGLLKAFGESEIRIEVLMEIVDTQLSIQRFEHLLDRCGYRTVKRQFYLINPIYEFKFGLKPKEQLPVIRNIPWLRDFVTTTSYYVIQPTGRKA